MSEAKRDQNHVTTMLGVSSVDSVTPTLVKIDPVTGRLLVDSTGGSGYTNLTQFVSQTPWRIFYSDVNGDVLEFAFGAAGEVLTSGGASAAPTWSSAGSGDMTLAGVQSVTGLKTFDNSKIALKGSSTGVTTFASANASGTGYTATFPAKTGTVAMTSDITNVQLPTYIVAASGGDYTTIQGALDAAAANYPQGCRIFLTDDVYTLTATLLVKSNNVVIEGNFRGTEIDIDGSLYSPAIKTNTPASLYQGLQLHNLSFIQTNGTAQGVCIDASDMALCWYDNLIIYNFGTGIKFVDTQNITFYNKTSNVQISANAGKCIDIDSSGGNSVNNNTFSFLRCSYGANGTGVHLDKAQLNVFYSCNFEPTSLTGTTGIKIVATTADTTINNVFYAPYVEANAVGISLGANTHRTQFYGGQVVENTTNLSDSGTNSMFVGIDINYTQTNKQQKLEIGNAIELGSASDTSITRTGAGAIAVEGVAVLLSGGALGTPSSGTVTNLTGTASININGTVGATTPAAGTFTTIVAGSTTSLLLGTAGSAVGNIGFRNATSGTITLAPATGALGTVTLTLPAATDTVAALAATQTFTNKRITKRTGTTTSSATPTINTDNVDFYSLTAQTVDITSFTTNLSGTPTENQTLWIAITGTAARAITWGTSFEASTVALPTTTVTTNRLDVLFVWNTVSSKWRCVASA